VNKQHLLENIKGYAVLVAAMATALLGVFAVDSKVGQALTVVAVVSTALAGLRIPAPPRRKPRNGL
jgi:hypothetical protein